MTTDKEEALIHPARMCECPFCNPRIKGKEKKELSQELRKRNPITVCTLDENEDCAFCTWNECCDELEKMEKE